MSVGAIGLGHVRLRCIHRFMRGSGLRLGLSITPMIGIGRGSVVLTAAIIVAIIELIVTIVLIRASAVLLVKARTILAQHAKIVIRELEIIFAHHAIALHLGVAGQRLVFLEELVGVSTRAIVDPVTAIIARIRTIRAGPASATTAAVVLTIINQRPDVLVLVVI
jgi:hypothetical protein